MNYQEFLSKIDTARINGLAELESKVEYYAGSGFEAHTRDMNLIGYVLVGESSGGSCWGDTAHYETHSYDDSFKTYALATMMRAVAPDIRYLDFLELSRLIHSDEYLESHYYGNYQEYQYCYVDYKEIYKFLEKAGYV